LNKILVVDDEQSVLELLKVNLTADGYEVLTASDGKEAIMKAQSEEPSLIFLDVKMPEMNGWEVLRILRADERTRNIPVVLITALPESISNQLTSHILKADGFLNKPFDPEKITQLAHEFISD
jgi:CheY-like chemotaxis protein